MQVDLTESLGNLLAKGSKDYSILELAEVAKRLGFRIKSINLKENEQL
jgi:hypothetical protein